MFAIVKDRFGQILRPFVLAHFLVIISISCPSFLLAALVSIVQTSNPVGYVEQSSVVSTGTVFQVNEPPLLKDGYQFGFWTANDQNFTDHTGRPVITPSITVNSGLTFVAHYFEQNADTDNDGIDDWFEYRNFGNLEQTLEDDRDGDGFSNKQENQLGQVPSVKDKVEDGGISARSTNSFVFGRVGSIPYQITSNPAGFLSSQIAFGEENSSIHSPSLNGEKFGYNFSFWSLNGQRQVGLTGVAINKLDVSLTEEMNLVAHYINKNEDTDGDQIMDWFEYNQFGDLNLTSSDDPDQDGFTIGQESILGQEAMIEDLVRDGGISARSSTSFVYADSSLLQYTVQSNPVGFIERVVRFVKPGVNVETSTQNGPTNGYHFTHWSVNGVPQKDSNGLALSKVHRNLTEDSIFVAHFVKSNEDSDADGIMDWFEYNRFGDLAQGPDGDPDSDLFTNRQEDELGQNPVVQDIVKDGGISSRSSLNFIYYLQANRSPYGIEISKNEFMGDENSSLLVGEFLPLDYDDPNQADNYTYEFFDNNQSNDNDKFTIIGDELKTKGLLSLGSYFIHVQVKDDGNASFNKIIELFSVLNGDKDSDGDGLTLRQELDLGTNPDKSDTDGDGFSDKTEFDFGSDPLNPLSLPNQVPTAIELDDNEILENQPKGSLVGKLTGVDGDQVSGFVFTLIEGPGSIDNTSFRMGQNGKLLTDKIIDFEKQPTYAIRIKMTDKFNASIESNFTIEAIDTNPPTLETFDATLLDSGGFQMSGKILSDGGLPITKIGFHLNNDISFSSATSIISKLDNKTNEFSSSAKDVATEVTYYFRAYASNSEGTTLGNVKNIRIAKPAPVNQAPYAIEITKNEFLADENKSLLIGQLIALDLDDTNRTGVYKFKLTDDHKGNNNFVIEGDKLKTISELPVGNYSVRVQVTDNDDASFIAEIKLVAIVNGEKDADGDGLTLRQELELGTNPNRVDTDGDGFSDKIEFDQGTDPLNAKSRPNQSPTAIELDYNKILEGQPPGTLVGKLSGVDVDQVSGFTFTLLKGSGSADNDYFKIGKGGQLLTNQVIDFEKQVSYDIRIKVADNFNASFENNFTIEALDGNVPIPRTIGATLLENGALQINGEILTDGGLSITNVGFHLDYDISFTAPTSLVSKVDPKTNQFSFTIADVDTDLTYYIRAFASNFEGQTVGGIKKVKSTTTPQDLKWAGDTTVVEADWLTSPWFGSFKTTSRNWIYHADMGWLYPSPMEDGSLWLWNQIDGWRWTQDGVYPYLFRWRDSAWVYLQGRINGRILYYNYSTQSYE